MVQIYNNFFKKHLFGDIFCKKLFVGSEIKL